MLVPSIQTRGRKVSTTADRNVQALNTTCLALHTDPKCKTVSNYRHTKARSLMEQAFFKKDH